MSLLGVRVLLVAIVTFGVAVGVAGAVVSFDAGPAGRPGKPTAARLLASGPGIDSLFRSTADRAPFRAIRLLAAVGYDPSRRTEPAPVAVPSTKPVLVLSGLTGGRDPVAVIEGFPGIEEPRVVRRGEMIGELTIKRIYAAGVVIAGLDTVWNLKLRTSWP